MLRTNANKVMLMHNHRRTVRKPRFKKNLPNRCLARLAALLTRRVVEEHRFRQFQPAAQGANGVFWTPLRRTSEKRTNEPRREAASARRILKARTDSCRRNTGRSVVSAENTEIVKDSRRLTAMIGGVIYDVKQNVVARQSSRTAANELKLYGLCKSLP